MGRPRRIKPPREGGVRAPERTSIKVSGVELELYANSKYKPQELCLTTYWHDNPQAAFQTTLYDLEQLIEQFKQLRGIQRVRKPTQKRQTELE